MFSDLEGLLTAMSATGIKNPKEYIAKLVKGHAHNRARDELGYDLSPEELYQAASEAVNAPVIADFLAEDLAEFAKTNGLPFDRAATTQFALDRFERRQVKEVINIKRLEGYLARDNKKLETALLKGDIPTAFKWKQMQYLHQVELIEAHKFLKVWTKAGKTIRRLASRKHFSTMAQEYTDRIHQLLMVHQVPVKRKEQDLIRALARQGGTLERFVNDRVDEGQPLVYHELPLVAPNRMTVEEFRKFREMISALVTVGRDEATTIFREKREEWDAVIQLALDGAGGVPVRPLDRNVGDWKPQGGRLRRKLRQYDAAHRILESMFDYLDDEDINGVHNTLLLDGATKAANSVDRMQAQIYSPIIDKFKALPKATRNQYHQVVAQSIFLDPRDGEVLTIRRGDVLALALNMGTEANQTKLAEGYGTTPEAIENFLNTHMTAPEAEFVQFVWDQLTEKLFPLADQNAREMRGFGLTKEESVPITLAGVNLKGGYYPLAYDPKFKVAIDFDSKGDPLNDKLKPFRVVTTPSGFEKDRTGYIGPISLSLDAVLKDHMRDVMVRIAYGKYVQQAKRFIADPKIKQLWMTKLGDEYYSLLMPWLEFQVFDVGTPIKDTAVVQGFFRKLRQNMTLTYMGFSYSVGIKQLLGAIPLVNEIGIIAALDGYRSFYFNALTQRLDKAIYSKSEEMKYRHYNLEQNVRDVHEDLHALDITASPARKFYKAWGDASMKYINAMDKWSVSGAGWMGAYRKARYGMAMSEGDAIRYADKVVRKTQGTGRPKDLPAVQRPNNEFQRILTFAYTWPGRYYNLLAEGARQFKMGRPLSGARRAWWLLFVLPIVSAWADGDFPDKDDDAEDWLWWMLRTITFGAVGTTVFTRDAATFANRRLSGRMAGEGSTPLTRLIEAAGSAIKITDKGIKVTEKNWIRSWAALMGMMGFLPAGGQIGKTGQFVSDVKTNKQNPKTVVDWYQGLTSGKMEQRK